MTDNFDRAEMATIAPVSWRMRMIWKVPSRRCRKPSRWPQRTCVLAFARAALNLQRSGGPRFVTSTKCSQRNRTPERALQSWTGSLWPR